MGFRKYSVSQYVGFSKYFARVAGTTLAYLHCVYTMCLPCGSIKNVNIYRFGTIFVPFWNFCGVCLVPKCTVSEKKHMRFCKMCFEMDIFVNM